MSNIFEYLKTIFPQISELKEKEMEEFVIQEIFKSPYQRASVQQIYNIIKEDYYPGLFQMSIRKIKPAFLLEETQCSYEKWLDLKLESEINQLYLDDNLACTINRIGKDTLLYYCKNILDFKNKNDTLFADLVVNQEYSDIFRRMLMLLLTGNSLYIFNNHKHFNELGRIIAPKILEMTSSYKLKDRLVQSIASGLIGMDIKENHISTAPIGKNISLVLKENETNQLLKQLEFYKNNPEMIGIDCFEQYYNEVICGQNLHVVWFTDDYIETIFEMKFIEEQLYYNKTLTFTLVPRFDSYSNDASYKDVLEMLEIKELNKLKNYYSSDRFRICRNGMDISSVNFLRMSIELYDIISSADICVISGARAFEMTQGIKKTVYYTGIAVCKSYTESITGFSRHSGKLVFLRQESGDCSFIGFEDRAYRKLQDGDHTISASKITAKEYYNMRYKNEKNC